MISVIIPTFNKAEYLELTLASFVNQTCKDYELIVVDDGSEDNTKIVVNDYMDIINIKYFFQNNKGRASARNTGILQSSGTLIIFNDDDRIVSPFFIEEHKKKHKNNSNLILIGWKYNVLSIWKPDELPLLKSSLRKMFPNLEHHNKIKLLLHPKDIIDNFSESIKPFIVGEEPDNHIDIIKAYSESLDNFNFPWVLGTTGNLSVAKQKIEKVGLFDENYKGWGVEDTDFCYRLYNEGGVFRVDKGASNYHQIHPIGQKRSPKDHLSIERKRTLNKNYFYFCNKFQDLHVYLAWRSFFSENMNLKKANEIINQNNKSVKEELKNLYECLIKNEMKGNIYK
ncbi:glycosyltransferase [Shouchella clausii]|uniref:glycosyltransferase n=1 Tax=Shouchella clausii TaxID=79880 RepID=UPI000B974B93|nr:glycosyltransferase [Shouchella clausii]AST96436.1 hypothetical protein BC8716_10955 [Shouchella clausii]MCR1290283.1 glycosyltransferase [Shouchella clausii]MEB5474987.1 glycosyltransferase [Shouchella clausii]QNM42792.1 glycosyltransferase [Shouchella clausii]WQG94353.1 glycosyltransferase [Shouchella clausii]